MFVTPGTQMVNAIHSSHSLFLPDSVLQVDGAATTGSPLCVAKCALSSEEREKLATGRSDEESPGLGREERYYRKSSIRPLRGLTYFRPISRGGLIETGRAYLRWGTYLIYPYLPPYPLVHRGKIDSRVVKIRRTLSINQ